MRKSSYAITSVTVVDEACAVLERRLAECQASAAWARSDAEVVEALRRMFAHIQGSTSVVLQLVRQAEGRGIPATHGATRTAAWLSDLLRITQGTANRWVRAARCR